MELKPERKFKFILVESEIINVHMITFIVESVVFNNL